MIDISNIKCFKFLITVQELLVNMRDRGLNYPIQPLIAEDTLKMVDSMAVSFKKTSWSMEAGKRN